MATKRRYETDKKARATLVKNLEKLPDHMLACKSMLHAWAVENDFHVENVVQEGRRKTMHIARLLVCMRGCGVYRKSVYIVGKNGLELIRQYYLYTDDRYKMPGLPRGMKPGEVVREEEYRRAMEKAVLREARTKKGAKA